MSSYFARYRFSSYSAGDRVACNIFFPWEFLRPLLKGGTVYVVPDDVVFLPRALAAFIAEHRISEILFTPSLLQGVLNSADHKLLRAQLSSLRVVWLNGEVVPTSLLKLALDVLPDSARVFNTYSISETHDVCTVDLTDLPLDGMDVCPVGLPMDGVTVRVLPEGAFHSRLTRRRRVVHRRPWAGPWLLEESRPGCQEFRPMGWGEVLRHRRPRQDRCERHDDDHRPQRFDGQDQGLQRVLGRHRGNASEAV